MTSGITMIGKWLVCFTLLFLAAGNIVVMPASAQISSFTANWSTNQQADMYSGQIEKALDWMKSQQQPDGSFAGFGAGSTVDAVLAIVASGKEASSFTSSGNTPVGFLESKAADIAKTPGGAGKLLIAVSALGRDIRSFGGVNLLDAIGTDYPASGHYGEDVIGHAFAMLGLHAAGQTIPPRAIEYLKSTQISDGGWAFSGDIEPGAGDTNTTAVAVQALVAAGVSQTDPTMERAKQYLLSQQNASDGGFPFQKGGEGGSDSDVNSTAYVSQALHYLGAQNRGLEFILAMQKPNGAFKWKASEPDDSAGATYQAIPALLGVTLVSPKSANAGGEKPGMPRTGAGEGLYSLVLLVTFVVISLLAGTYLRAKSEAR